MKEFVYSRFLLPALEHASDEIGVHDGPYHATFGQHGERVLRLCHAMATELGLGPRERFGVLGLNGHEYLELYHAAFLGGGVITPLNFRLAPGELAYILRQADVAVVFVDERCTALFDEVRAAAGAGLSLRHVVRLGPPGTNGPGGYEELLRSAAPAPPPEPDEDDPVALIYTGGTTGLPRGALFDQRAPLLYMVHSGISGGVGFRRGWTYLHEAPFFHSTTVVTILSAPVFGVVSVIEPRFDPASCLETIERHRVQETILVPTMIQMLLGHADFSPHRIASLRRLGYGGMPISPGLLARLKELLPDLELVQGYGMTEAGGLTVLGAADHSRPELLASVGRAVPGVVLSVRDPRGAELGVGEVGEVWARGGNLMREYWKEPEATAEAFRGGWYHTGDAGWMDPEGYLFLVDRVKDMIVTGGENVYSVEVENAIASHPGVAQVAVIGIPHQVWGEQVHAIVVPRAEATVTAQEVVDHARRSLAGYKVPKSVEIRSEPLPMSAAMKPLKRELRPGPRGQLA